MSNITDIFILASILSISKKEIEVYAQTSSALYYKIELDKKLGGTRTINAPCEKLKNLQRLILDKVLMNEPLEKCVYGCMRTKSIIENARMHINAECMLSLDIKDFFPSVHHTKVLAVYKNLGWSDDVAKILCRISTLNYSLPQGAPTSPYISNLVLRKLDKRLMSFAKDNRLTYTRYFDDMTFSGSSRILDLKNKIQNIVTSSGYKINSSKTKVYGRVEDKVVTGLVIRNKTLFIKDQDDFIDYLNSLKSFGMSRLRSLSIEKEKQSILGKISFIASVDKTTANNLKSVFKMIEWK